MREKVVPGPLATIDSIFILFVSGVYLYTTKGFTGFQSLLLGILIIIGFNILLRIKYVGTVILFLSSFIWAFGIFSLLPLEKWVNNSLSWKIAVFIILFLLSLAFHFKPVDESKDFTPEQVAALNAYDQAVELSKMQKKAKKYEEKEEKKRKKKLVKEAKSVSTDNTVAKSMMPQLKDVYIILSTSAPDNNIYFKTFNNLYMTFYDAVSGNVITRDYVENHHEITDSYLNACADDYYNMHGLLLDTDMNVISFRTHDTDNYAFLGGTNDGKFTGSSLVCSKSYLRKVANVIGESFYLYSMTDDSINIYRASMVTPDGIRQMIGDYKKDLEVYDPSHYLSDNIYLYDFNKESLSLI